MSWFDKYCTRKQLFLLVAMSGCGPQWRGPAGWESERKEGWKVLFKVHEVSMDVVL